MLWIRELRGPCCCGRKVGGSDDQGLVVGWWNDQAGRSDGGILYAFSVICLALR